MKDSLIAGFRRFWGCCLVYWILVPIQNLEGQEAPIASIRYLVDSGIGELKGPTEAREGDTILVRAIPGEGYALDRMFYRVRDRGGLWSLIESEAKEVSIIVRYQTQISVSFVVFQQREDLTLKSLGVPISNQNQAKSWELIDVSGDGSFGVGYGEVTGALLWTASEGVEPLPYSEEDLQLLNRRGNTTDSWKSVSPVSIISSDSKAILMYPYYLWRPEQSVEQLDSRVWDISQNEEVLLIGYGNGGKPVGANSQWDEAASGTILSDDGTVLLGQRRDLQNGTNWKESGTTHYSESPVIYTRNGDTFMAPAKASALYRYSAVGRTLSSNGARVGIVRTTVASSIIWDWASSEVYSLRLGGLSIDLNEDGTLALLQGNELIGGTEEMPMARAFLYEVGGRVISLEDLVQEKGLTGFKGWHKVRASFITDNGRTIFGIGTNLQGHQEPWMLTGLDPVKLFPPVKYSLEAVPIHGGIVEGMGNYPQGNRVRIKANAHPGFRFQRWIGDIQSDQNPLEIRAMEDLQIDAEFVLEEDYSSPVELNPEALRKIGSGIFASSSRGSNTNYLVRVDNDALVVRDLRTETNYITPSDISRFTSSRVSEDDRTVVVYGGNNDFGSFEFFRLPSLVSLGELNDQEGLSGGLKVNLYFESWGFSPDSRFLVYPRRTLLNEVDQHLLRILEVDTQTVVAEIQLTSTHDRLVVKNTTGPNGGGNNPFSFAIDGVECFLVARSNKPYTVATLEFVEWHSGQVVKRHTVEDGRFNEGDFSSDGVFFYPSSAQNSIVGVNLLTGKLRSRIGAFHGNDLRFSQRIGFLNFLQDGDVMSWYEYQYRVNPTERFSGFDLPKPYSVVAFAPDQPRHVEGYVFEDTNSNNILDLERVSSNKPYIVFIADTSLSTRSTLQGVSVGNPNIDRYRNSILDAEIQGLKMAYDSLRRYGRANDAHIAIVSYSGTALAYGPAGVVENRNAWIPALADDDKNLEFDVNDAISKVSYNSTIVVEQSSYVSALDKVRGIIADTGISADSVLVVFLSDGKPDFGGLNPSLEFLLDAGVAFKAVGITDNADLDSLRLMDASVKRVFSSTELMQQLHFAPTERVLVGATVFADVNQNGSYDSWEPAIKSSEEDLPTLKREAGFFRLDEVTLGSVPIFVQAEGLEQSHAVVLPNSRGGAETVMLAMVASSIPHPADVNQDFSISIGELTAYGAAWKSGQIWPEGPSPIPIGFLTRAGALWKGGEKYSYDISAGSKPLAWVSSSGGL